MLRLQSLFCFLFATIPLAGVEAASITMTIPAAASASSTGSTYVSTVENAGDISEGADVTLTNSQQTLTLVVSGSSLDTDKITTHCVGANPNTLDQDDGVLTITCKSGGAPLVRITLTPVVVLASIPLDNNLTNGKYVPSIAGAGTAVAHPTVMDIAGSPSELVGLSVVGKNTDTDRIKAACVVTSPTSTTSTTTAAPGTIIVTKAEDSASVWTISCDTTGVTGLAGVTITLTPEVTLRIPVTPLAAGVFSAKVTNAGGITKAGTVSIPVGESDFALVVVGPDTDTARISAHCVDDANVPAKANKLSNTPLVNTPGVQDITCGGGSANELKVTIKLQPVTTEADIMVKVSGLVAGKYTPTLTNAGNIKELPELTLGAGSLGSVTISVTAMAQDIARIKKHCVDSVAAIENELAVVSGVATITCHGGTTNINTKVKITLTPVATTVATTTAGAFQAIPSVFAIMAVVFAMSVM